MNSQKRILGLLLMVVTIGAGMFVMGNGVSLANNQKNKPAYFNMKGFPIVKQPITLRILIKTTMNMRDPKDILVFREYEKKTGIKINWISVDQTKVNEKMALSLASDDLPDAYMRTGLSNVNQFKYGSQGLLVDLSKGLLKKYAPNAQKFMEKHKDVKKSQTFANGAIYSLPEGVEIPVVRIAKKLFINTSWLKKVGKKMPATTDELYNVLKAFKEKDPNGNGKADEIPLTANGLSTVIKTLQGAWGIGNRGYLPDNIDFDPKSKKVRFIPVAPEYKEMVTYLRKLYREGLLDKEIFSMSAAQLAGKGIEGVIGAYPDPNLANMATAHVAEYEGLSTALKGPKGYRIWSSLRPYSKSTGAFIITKANKYPEATLRWVDYFYTDEGTRFYHFGVEGVSCKKKANGKYDWSDQVYKEAKQANATFDGVVGKYSPYLGGTNPAIIKEPYYGGMEMEPVSYKAAMNMMRFVPKEAWPEFTYTEAENDQLVVLKSDINGYVKKMLAEFVFGNTPLTEWDNYVNQIKKMGLDAMMKIHNEAYQRYKSK